MGGLTISHFDEDGLIQKIEESEAAKEDSPKFVDPQGNPVEIAKEYLDTEGNPLVVGKCYKWDYNGGSLAKYAGQGEMYWMCNSFTNQDYFNYVSCTSYTTPISGSPMIPLDNQEHWLSCFDKEEFSLPPESKECVPRYSVAVKGSMVPETTVFDESWGEMMVKLQEIGVSPEEVIECFTNSPKLKKSIWNKLFG